MISTRTAQYKLPKESLMLIQEPQIRLFEDEFKVSLKKEFIGINFNQRGYTVNDKFETIIDSKFQGISFFSGAGGLDIGSIIGQIASGGVGGGILMVIVGLIKQAMGGQKVG